MPAQMKPLTPTIHDVLAGFEELAKNPGNLDEVDQTEVNTWVQSLKANIDQFADFADDLMLDLESFKERAK